MNNINNKELFTLCRNEISIEEVLNYLNIERINGKYLCPFHEDTNPSMSIWKGHNKVKCWVCESKALSTIDVFMLYYKCTALEAANKLKDIKFFDHVVINKSKERSMKLLPEQAIESVRILSYFYARLCRELNDEEKSIIIKERGFSAELLTKNYIAIVNNWNRAFYELSTRFKLEDIKTSGLRVYNNYNLVFPHWVKDGTFVRFLKFRDIFNKEAKKEINIHSKIFIPYNLIDIDNDKPMLLCEGIMDVLSALTDTKEYNAIGLSGITFYKNWLMYFRDREVIIAIDHDKDKTKIYYKHINFLADNLRKVTNKIYLMVMPIGIDIGDYVKSGKRLIDLEIEKL